MDDNLQVMLSIYPNFKGCTIQTFCDDKELWDNRLAHKFSQNWINRDEIKKLNDKWAWIFFSVNSMKEWERDKESVIWINAWACEIDGMDKELQRNLIEVSPLYPSLIVESKNSYHMYWFAKDGTKENWNKICRGLRNFFDGDPAIASDISRVLRVPGFNHLKDRNNPFKCTVYWWIQKYYTEEEMLQAYSDTMTISEKREQAQKREEQFKKELWDDDFWERIKAMDTKTMILKLSWNWMVSYETFDFKRNSNGTEQIIVNWKVTGNWLDKNWKIWSTDRWWPHWTNRVFRYGLAEWKDVYQWIAKEFPMMIPEKKVVKKIQQQVVEPKINIDNWDYEKEKEEQLNSMLKIKDIYKWWKMVHFMVKELDEILSPIHLWTLSIIIWAPNSWKTTFSYLMMLHNLKLWLKVGFVSCEMTMQDIMEQYYLWTIWAMDRFMEAKLTDEDDKKLWEYKRELLTNANFYYQEDLNCTIDNLKVYVEKVVNYGCEVIFIDNLVKITWTGNELQDNRIVIEYLYQVAKDKWVAIILLHHTDKAWWLNNTFTYRWTWDVQIKPDNLFFLKRPALTRQKDQEEIEPSADEKAELVVKRAKQRLGSAHLEEYSIYFYRGMYYTITEFTDKVLNSKRY